jgi:hypothetical protein
LSFAGITTVNQYGLSKAFLNDNVLTKAPDLSPITTLNGHSAMYQTFGNCTALTTPPDLSGLTTIVTGSSVLSYTFNGCTSLTTGPDLSNLNNVNFAYPNTSIFSRMLARLYFT